MRIIARRESKTTAAAAAIMRTAAGYFVAAWNDEKIITREFADETQDQPTPEARQHQARMLAYVFASTYAMTH